MGFFSAIARTLFTGRRHFEPRPGIWIEPKGRDEFLYHDGERMVVINAEMANGELDRLIYTSSISSWLGAQGASQVSPEERSVILDDLCRYLQRIGRTYEIR